VASLSSLFWITGSTLALGLATLLCLSLRGERRSLFLPGQTSAGHRQIEDRCEVCHVRAFMDAEDFQRACLECHGDELRTAEDSHPRSKFTDPRNADRVAILDARNCITCHAEHTPETTRVMGVTLPGDLCFHCHREIAGERPSHRGAGFDSCATSGCHHFHDNRGLYEDFLRAHLDEPELLPTRAVPARTPRPASGRALAEADRDAPAALPDLARHAREWAASSHARAGVNCSDCHAPARASWSDRVAPATCGRCHEGEQAGFERGRHGMRVGAGLTPLKVAHAILPMRADAAERELGCASCHSAHVFDPGVAAVEACLRCHADDHSLAYEGSPHARIDAAPGDESRVSCATCHLPRAERRPGVVEVEHNQNDNLRPSDKMLRTVCMRCHGLGFSIDALADVELIRSNFRGSPRVHVESLSWTQERLASGRR
jgi:predicted CXXCH cytochrome family protein